MPHSLIETLPGVWVPGTYHVDQPTQVVQSGSAYLPKPLSAE